VESGILSPKERVELLEGDIVRMWPQGPAHAVAVANTEQALRRVFGSGYHARVQMPFVTGDNSEPEPDVAIVPGHPRNYILGHPSTAILLVEVADTTLDYDRRHKGPAHA